MKIQLLMPYKHSNDAHRAYLLHKCLTFLDTVNVERHVFADKLVDEENELFTHHHFQIHLGFDRGEWRTVKEAYDMLDGPLVAICHADDFWIEGKLEAQLKYIQKYPIVVTGYLLNKDRFEQREYCLRHRILTHDEGYGLVDCMPSTWLLNKTLLPTLPVPFFARYCSDLAVLLAISIYGSIAVIKNSFVFYNEHNNNQGTTIPRSEVEAGRDQLRAYAKTIPRPKLVYYWE